MKKSLFLYFSLTAIAAGSFSSCQEEDYGFDYATIKHSVYERDFLKEFGNPAPNHQWGFDKANATFQYLMTGELPVFESSGTRAVIKQDQNIVINGVNMYIQDLYGMPADITPREHAEVYEWFTCHQVNWTNTPTYYQGSSTRQTTDGTAHLRSDVTLSSGNSLRYYSENTLGDYTINVNLTFHDAWVQHVNSNHTQEDVVHLVTGAGDSQNYPLSKAGVSVVDGKTVYTDECDKATKMNYLYTMGLNMDGSGSGWQAHLNDFNTGSGYGYGKQSSQNGIFVSNALIDTWTYDCSNGSSLKHDKYFIVYLKGGYESDPEYDNADTRYEGWYLGFDYESWGTNTNERVFADGICNDWIIKLSAATPELNPARIMCEDLGGSFDTDFNDLVYDVYYDSHTNKISITVQAVGGTLPIKLTYNNNGTEKTIYDELHAEFGVSVTTPINVSAKGGASKDPKTYEINGVGNIGNFSLDNINVYVYSTDRAEWVNITLLDESSVVPCRICVPQTVMWPAELQSITWAYPGFVNWVKDPTSLFWSGTVNQKYLYGTYTPEDTPPSSGSNSGTQNKPTNNTPPSNGQSISLIVSGNNYRFPAMNSIPDNARSVTLTFTFDNNINGAIGVLGQYGFDGATVGVGYSTSSPLSVTITGDLLSAARSGNLGFASYGSVADIKKIEYSVGN